MHARIDELLSLRDGDPVAASLVSHVESCPACALELAQLQRTQRQMRSLASFVPPAVDRERIAVRVQPQPARHGRQFAFAAAAAVSVLAVAIGLVTRDEAPSVAGEPVATTGKNPPVAAPLDQLVEQSRELDELLQYLPQRPSVERVAMAGTIDTLEQRIQWLDVQLSYAPDAGLSELQAYRLWRERVDLMDSLVKVRYAESSRLAF
jgi:hypothetical protein